MCGGRHAFSRGNHASCSAPCHTSSMCGTKPAAKRCPWCLPCHPYPANGGYIIIRTPMPRGQIRIVSNCACELMLPGYVVMKINKNGRLRGIYSESFPRRARAGGAALSPPLPRVCCSLFFVAAVCCSPSFFVRSFFFCPSMLFGKFYKK